MIVAEGQSDNGDDGKRMSSVRYRNNLVDSWILICGQTSTAKARKN